MTEATTTLTRAGISHTNRPETLWQQQIYMPAFESQKSLYHNVLHEHHYLMALEPCFNQPLSYICNVDIGY